MKLPFKHHIAVTGQLTVSSLVQLTVSSLVQLTVASLLQLTVASLLQLTVASLVQLTVASLVQLTVANFSFVIAVHNIFLFEDSDSCKLYLINRSDLDTRSFERHFPSCITHVHISSPQCRH
jgi:hypothetical protein